MCVLSDKVGDDGRPWKGGGLIDSPRGVPGLDGAGERTGDEAPVRTNRPGTIVDVSSSDVELGSSSFNNDDTRAGPVPSGRTDDPFTMVPWPLVVASAAGVVDGPGTGDGAEPEPDPSAWVVANRLVRGRFNLRSGSCVGSAGEAVMERVLRFRDLEAVPPSSAARASSNAPQARRSSLVS